MCIRDRYQRRVRGSCAALSWPLAVRALVLRMGNGSSGEALTEIKVASRNFDSSELQECELLFAQIRTLSSNQQGLDKASFQSHFPMPGLLGDRLFMVLDFKNDGFIDYEEFLCGLAVACRGSIAQCRSVCH
eukprot:TRINITY_DN3876_c0_g1_i1.p1 TRINITY_DN3876_c0_g1~~TRINITY_DN3876_c0_g1_i1.p1  ORF type:complete len:132 (-),score=31.90 TRINITY_DN3876_c0_g1_i1:409-804(-)